MDNLRKTLQHGTPGAAAQQDRAPAAPAAQPARQPQPSAGGDEGPPSSVFEPPPPGSDELRQTHPPAGHRTPSASQVAPNFGPPLPDDAPGWMLRARRMSLALEDAIRARAAAPSMEACIERAWAAWELAGTEDRHISRVAHLVQKAHAAIRETPAADVDRAYGECAQVMWASLPRQVKARHDFAAVQQLTRELRAEADSWAAVVDATARLLGWTHAGRAHAAHAVRLALLAGRTGSGQ